MSNKTIAVGVVSEYARLVQRVLRETINTSLSVDGVVGNLTMNAIGDFAQMLGLDRKVGYSEEVQSHVDKYIGTRFAQEATYRAAAETLKVAYNHFRAVCEVESNGSAFLPDGRSVILFERHWFRKNVVEAVKVKKTYEAIKRDSGFTGDGVPALLEYLDTKYPDIFNAKRGGYTGGASEYTRLDRAVKIHMESAYASASYGAFQIMGFNHKAAGYSSATAMMLDYAKSEERQIWSLVSFILTNKTMHTALQIGNWHVFAREYNGPAYAENNYNVKLSKSADRWLKMV